MPFSTSLTRGRLTQMHDDTEHDPRAVDELINVALSEPDENLRWNAISALHWRGSMEVLQRAASLCESTCSFERVIGTEILGQLGVPERSFPAECGEILCRMLRTETDTNVLQSVLSALSHLRYPAAILLAARFATHLDPAIRYGVVFALTGYESQLAVAWLIRLSADPDDDVRDWATFALGTQIDLDTPKLRDALAARLEDSDDDTRAEAMVGLARRKDRRVVAPLQNELQKELVGSLVIEAAELIAAPELLPYLIAMRPDRFTDCDLEEAIAACARG